MLFTNVTLVTLNPMREIITDGAIAIAGDRIAAIGKSEQLLRQYRDDEIIDGQGKMLIPGLIDTHVHLARALLRGGVDQSELAEWSGKQNGSFSGAQGVQTALKAEEAYASTRLCLAEMLRAGTTTFLECQLSSRYGFDSIAQVVEESGIRACLAGAVMDSQTRDILPGVYETRERSLQQVLDAYSKWNGQAEDRIQVWLGPGDVRRSSLAFLQEIGELARQQDMGITLHFAEREDDPRYLAEKYGLSPAAYVERAGLLGPKTVLSHAVWLQPEDIELLARSGTSISHNPTSNSKLAAGNCPISQLRAKNVNVALGCDGGAGNDTYDLIREMKQAVLLYRAVNRDPIRVSAETALEMATLNGARALGLEHEIGSLEVGKKADLVLLNFQRLHTTPMLNPVATLIYAATGGEVETVVIDGQIVVEQGQLLTMDEEEILEEANLHARAFYRRAGIAPRSGWPIR